MSPSVVSLQSQCVRSQSSAGTRQGVKLVSCKKKVLPFVLKEITPIASGRRLNFKDKSEKIYSVVNSGSIGDTGFVVHVSNDNGTILMYKAQSGNWEYAKISVGETDVVYDREAYVQNDRGEYLKLFKGGQLIINGHDCIVKNVLETSNEFVVHIWDETEGRHLFLCEKTSVCNFTPKSFSSIAFNITSSSSFREFSALSPCDIAYVLYRSALNGEDKDAELASKLACTDAFKILRPAIIKVQYSPYNSKNEIPSVSDEEIKNKIIGSWYFDNDNAAVLMANNGSKIDKNSTVYYARRIEGRWRLAIFPD